MTISTRATLDELLVKPVVLASPIRLVDPPSWHTHIPFAFWIVDALRPAAFVELGTHSGNSYAAFAQAVQLLGLQTACYAVDTWKGDEQAGFYGEDVFAEWSAFHQRHFSGFSRLIRATFDEALNFFADGSIDLLHIDGLHTYDCVRHDFETWLPKLSERGVVLMHDINVREAGFGAWKYWLELEEKYPCFAFLHGHGLGVVSTGREPAPLVTWLIEVARDAEQSTLVRTFFATLGEGLYNQWRVANAERRERQVAEPPDARPPEAGVAHEARAVTGADVEDRHPAADASRAEERTLEEPRLYTSESRLAEIARLRQELRNAGRALALERQSKRSDAGALTGSLLASLQRELDQADADLDAATEKADELAQSLSQAIADLRVKDATVRALSRTVADLQASRSWRLLRAVRTGFDWIRPIGLTFRSARHPVRFARSLKASLSPRRLRHLRLVAESGLFDEAYYTRRYPDVEKSGMTPLVHFVMRGGGEGRSPSPLFDSAYYLARYPDVARSASNPLVHFLTRGHTEHRDPHPLFSTEYYLKSNPDVAALGGNALIHFLRTGGFEGRSPHPLFDSAFYLDQNPDVRAQRINPLVHFVQSGASEGRAPHALFDTTFYQTAYPDVSRAGVNPLEHYLVVGHRECRNPHPLFDTAYYLEHSRDVRELGADPLVHFVLHGSQEGRRPNRLFDPTWYLQSNPDVAESGLNPLAHFAIWGWRERRDPSPEFSTSFYLEHHPDISAAGLNPLAHYLATGVREGRVTRPAEAHTSSAIPPTPGRVQLTVVGDAAGGPDRPTIVCVSHALPWPPRAGNGYRVHRLLRRLRAIGYRVVLVAAPLPGDEVDDARFERLVEDLGNVVYCERDGRIRFRFQECGDALSALDRQVTRNYAVRLGESRPLDSQAASLLNTDRTFCHETVIAVVSALLRSYPSSALLVEYIWMSRVLPLVGPETLKLIDTHDVFSSKREKVAAYGIDDLQLPAADEARRLLRADVVIAIQEAEAHAFRELLPGRDVVLAGVDYEVSDPGGWSEDPIALLVASGNPMNVTGLRDFLRFTWPEVRRRVPHAELHVVGRVGESVPPGAAGVRVLGTIDDLTACYARARVVVNPAAAGTGLKIKTLEALSHLRPIVAWPNGLDGVPEPLASLCPPVEDYLQFAESVAAHLVADRSPFDDTAVETIRYHLSPEVVYRELEERLAKFFHRAGGAVA